MGKNPPPLYRRQLGYELRTLREQRGLICEEVASRLGWSISKISRIENARISVLETDLHRLLELLMVPAEQVSDLVKLFHRARRDPWWKAYERCLSKGLWSYLALEDEADTVCSYTNTVVAGLLQTEQYAEPLLRAWSLLRESSQGEIAALVKIRMRQQRIMDRDLPVQLHVIMDETALLRPVGSPETMSGQMRYLLERAALPHVRIRIRPFTFETVLQVSETFTLLQYAPIGGSHFPDVAAAETYAGSGEVFHPGNVEFYRQLWRVLETSALPHEASVDLIIQTLKQQWSG